MPRLAAIVRAPHRRGSIWDEASRVVAVQRDDPDRLGVARMGGHRKAELARQPGRDLLPASATVVRSINAAVILLIERPVPVWGHDEFVDALAELRISVRLKVCP